MVQTSKCGMMGAMAYLDVDNSVWQQVVVTVMMAIISCVIICIYDYNIG